MKSYKETSFEDRVARASEAKAKALAQLRAKPAPDPALLAERQAARERRDAEAAERRAARQAEKQAAAAAKAAAAEEAKAASVRAEPTEAERKAARDARYAARKGRR